MTQNILLNSPILFTGNALRTVIPVSSLLCYPRSSTNVKCGIRQITLGSSCSPGVLFLFVGRFFGSLGGWVSGCLFGGKWGYVFVLLLHLSAKVLTSKITLATSSGSEITRILTRSQKLSIYIRLSLPDSALSLPLTKMWEKLAILTTKSPKGNQG